jgi:tellurite resistance protein
VSTPELSENERVDLVRFLCSFAWADGEVQAEERAVLGRVIDGLSLDPGRHAEVTAWLSEAPDMDGFDFGAIAEDKRAVFLDLAFEVAAAHGGLGGEELGKLKMFMSFSDDG